MSWKWLKAINVSKEHFTHNVKELGVQQKSKLKVELCSIVTSSGPSLPTRLLYHDFIHKSSHSHKEQLQLLLAKVTLPEDLQIQIGVEPRLLHATVTQCLLLRCEMVPGDMTVLRRLLSLHTYLLCERQEKIIH